MRSPLYYVILCCLCTTSLVAQQEMKWGSIPATDLRMKEYSQDPEAIAVVLGDVGLIEYEFKSNDRPIRYERHVRIKLLTQAAVEQYGNATIWYYSRKNYAVLTALKAQVFLPDGKKVTVDNEHIYKSKEDDRFTTHTIAFPSLKPGAIIEYRYTIQSGDVYTPVDWYFQREIPVAYSDLTVKFPRWFDYVVLQQGRPIDDHQVEADSEILPGTNIIVLFQQDRYISRHVEGLREEEFITTMDDYTSRLRYQLRELSLPDKPRKPLMESWRSVEKELLESPDFGRAFLTLINGESVLSFAGLHGNVEGNLLDPAKQLFQFLCTHLRWNGSYALFANASIEEVLTNREGTSAELNLALLAGLRRMGIDAEPVITSTRWNGRPVELYPFAEQFNHILVQATIDGKQYFLDVAENQQFGLPRDEALNYRGWRVERDSSAWIDVYPEMSRSTYFLKLSVTPLGQLEGAIQAKFTAYHGARERDAFLENREEYFIDQLRAHSHELKVDQFEMQNVDDVNMPLAFVARIKGEPQIETSEFLYISMPCINIMNVNPLTEEKRTFPVEILFPYSYRFVIDILIPEGYGLESMPKDAALKTEDGGITFSYRCSENQGRIQMLADFAVTNLRYAPEHYGMLKLMFDQIVIATGEQIVLKKHT